MTGQLKTLRLDQQKAIDGLRSAILAGYRRPLLQAPTGFGKTVVAAHIVHGCHSRGKRVCFCVPALSLIDQTFERFVENGIPADQMGVIQGNHAWRRAWAPIQIATAQTLARRDFPETDVVVIDEAHVRHAVYETWMAEDRDRLFIGLSATPWARGLGKLFDTLIRPTSTAELIDLGHLSKFRVFAPSKPDLSGVKTVAGDYHEGELAERMNKPTLIGDIVDTWLAKAQNRPTLCFAVNRAHAQALHDRFAEVGVPVAYIDANTPREERDEIGKALAAGDVKVVCNIGTLTTGIDWDVRCIILARPTKSEALFVQIIGRGLRTAPGKDHCLILDHSDTHMRLGMVTNIDHDELDDGRKEARSDRKAKDRMPLPKECHVCGCLMPVLSRECVNCGTPAPKRIGVAHEDGTLVEFGGKTKAKVPSVTEALFRLGKPRVYGMLKWVQKDRKRSDGWTAHTFREIFGVWPNHYKGTPPQHPDPLLLSYIRAKDIRYANSARRNLGEAGHAV